MKCAIPQDSIVAVAVQSGAGPERLYFGQVTATDGVGVLIATMEREDSQPTGHHLFVPWASVSAALVAIVDDDASLRRFLGEASRWRAWQELSRGPTDRWRDGSLREQTGGAITPAVTRAIEWLSSFLSDGPKRVGNTRTAAESDGISTRALYAAKNRLMVEEYESEGVKSWRLTTEQVEPVF